MDGFHGTDIELISRTLQVEHKMFYFDLKKNLNGKYLKISEKVSGTRSTIIIPASGVRTFVDLFQYYVSGETPLESSEVQVNTKVFYFDVGENQRGRFLKVSEVNRNRSTIIVPAGNGDGEGWVSFRDILADINEGMQSLEPDENTSAGFQEGDNLSHALSRSLISGHENSGAMSRILRVEQKKFYFDLGRNARGQYLKVSEVTGPDRSSIVLPVSALEQFHEIIGQFLASVKTEETSVDVDDSAIGPPAPSRSWTED